MFFLPPSTHPHGSVQVVSSLERHTEAALAVENDTLVGVGHVAEGRVEERENEMDDYIVPDNRLDCQWQCRQSVLCQQPMVYLFQGMFSSVFAV